MNRRCRPVHLDEKSFIRPKTVIPKKTYVLEFKFYNVGSDVIYLSFDGGSSWKRVGAGGNIQIRGFPDLPIYFEDGVKVKSDVDGVQFEILYLKVEEAKF
ncbi:hypothetical protein J7L97_05915 [Candidatus Bathyarchaeota archaeon]|nr:hypothetical protein [Candidatus Bathyarchaeota archaeon]